MEISEFTRRNIADALRMRGIHWAGRLAEPDFLARVFDLEQMPSYDSRFRDAAGDIWQHRVNNYDWDEYWIFEDRRFNLLGCKDETFLRFLRETIHPVVRPDSREVEDLRGLLNELLGADGYELVEQARISGHPVFVARRMSERLPLGVSFAKSQVAFSTEYMSQQIARIEASLPFDPDLAIGTSKELLETCCKTILSECNVPFAETWDLPKLVKATYKHLKLTPDDIPDAAKAADTIRRLLSNLATVTQGLVELRNLYGTGHGKSATWRGLTVRHAKLAVGAATTLAVFLFETYDARMTRKG